MASNIESVAAPGRNRKVTDERILEILRSRDRPGWTAKALADYVDVSRQTAYNRLEKLTEKNDDVATMKAGRTTVYYSDVATTGSNQDPDAPLEERHKQSLIVEFEDRFVGLQAAPWTAIHPEDGSAEEGDKIQLHVEGQPGDWRVLEKHRWENSRENFIYEETSEDVTQALISGELYSKPTVPIEHAKYPDDYDIESEIGVEPIKSENQSAFLAFGPKNYLVRPCNDAVFLKGVHVDAISLKNHRSNVDTFDPEQNYSRSEAEILETLLHAYSSIQATEEEFEDLLSRGDFELNENSIQSLVNHSSLPVYSKKQAKELAEAAADYMHGDEGQCIDEDSEPSD